MASPNPLGAPTRLLSVSQCMPVHPSFSTYLSVQLAPAIQPRGVGGCIGKETPGQPGEGSKDTPGMIPIPRNDPFPLWLHTGLNPKTTLSDSKQGGINLMECWKHLSIWEYQKSSRT